MRARYSAKTLPAGALKACRDYLYNYQQAINFRFMAVMALALSDRLEFDQEQIADIWNAVCEICTGYNEDVYGNNKDIEDVEAMNDVMIAELKDRGINIERGYTYLGGKNEDK